MRRTSLRTIIGEVLTMLCAIRAGVLVAACVLAGDGLGMLAYVLEALTLVGLFITAAKYHDSEEMGQWPAIFMCGYLGSNILLIFSASWAYALMILPLIAMVLLITVFSGMGIVGIAAGALMFVLNLIGGIATGRTSSMALARLLVNNNSLMGIACILFFCDFPRKQSGGFVDGTGGGSSYSGGGGGGWM